MACATLKRSPDWDGVPQLPAKRRRWCPVVTPATSPSAAPFHHRQDPSAGAPPSPSSSPSPSPFTDPALRITPEQMAREICDEIKRLQHRKQLKMNGLIVTRDSDGSSSGTEGDSPRSNYNRVLFTFKQVQMICERMLREQEVALRTEYEATLEGKLAEQYESFVRFNQDQVRCHFTTRDVSYLS